ncbi:hypothetical protein EHP00_1733 [Ecytonucleospora hepatopenaei]|uniref:Uncharacterized protein n=1 Tax=Ecytonucleospora hepatopenaei TaxID=646526 RepID=A0A1W0E5D7_9MICR|nr:hypothetical protein EHP00_1733 [Ecytonucleospora hepatopenaei]
MFIFNYLFLNCILSTKHIITHLNDKHTINEFSYPNLNRYFTVFIPEPELLKLEKEVKEHINKHSLSVFLNLKIVNKEIILDFTESVRECMEETMQFIEENFKKEIMKKYSYYTEGFSLKRFFTSNYSDALLGKEEVEKFNRFLRAIAWILAIQTLPTLKCLIILTG